MQEAGDLNQIWDAICNGEFHGEHKPQKVFANTELQIMCVPHENGSGYEVYERRAGEKWVRLPTLRKQA